MTLFEVVMAGAVLAIAIMGTLSAWINSQRLQILQREESIAQAAISKAINDIRSLPFTQVDNDQTLATLAGFSGGLYGDVANRLKPGRVKLYMGWDGKGPKSDGALRGVKVSLTHTAGSEKIGIRYWSPAENTPELRIIFINNEVPTEARMGEDGDPTNASDGVDLNGDGAISETPLPLNPPPFEFGPVDAKPLFPRLLAVPITNPQRDPIDTYLNTADLTVYPVVVQVRWWSATGNAREISVITFLTNRAGSQAAAPDTTAY
ncbi:MAG: hypothetical protein NTW87_02895 [Planctomycetota bacterium]|nr:hypothetical protein [Planctomycetota bacterium]